MTNTTHLKGPIIYTFYGYLSVQLSNFSIHCKTTRPSGTSCKINRRLKCKSSSTYIVLKVVLQICLYRILYSFHFKLFCKEGTMILKIITINCHNWRKGNVAGNQWGSVLEDGKSQPLAPKWALHVHVRSSALFQAFNLLFMMITY